MTSPNQEPQPQDPLDEITFHGKTVREWHEWLSRDSGAVPCSRYGRTGDETAWWAIACELVYVGANGEDDDPIVALDTLMGLAVNDSDSVLELIREHWYSLPEALQEYLEYEDNGMTMAQQAKLYLLCQRYEVEYDPQHYYVYPKGQPWMDGWAEGWVGGIDHMKGTEHPTIYVGVDPLGRSHS